MGLVDAANGTVSARYACGPFDEPLRATGPQAANPFRFSTKYRDAETGLYYYGYRYYDPITGRWLSKDPVSIAGGPHLYAFVYNRLAVDKLGLFRIRPIDWEKWNLVQEILWTGVYYDFDADDLAMLTPTTYGGDAAFSGRMLIHITSHAEIQPCSGKSAPKSFDSDRYYLNSFTLDEHGDALSGYQEDFTWDGRTSAGRKLFTQPLNFNMGAMYATDGHGSDFGTPGGYPPTSGKITTTMTVQVYSIDRYNTGVDEWIPVPGFPRDLGSIHGHESGGAL